MTTKQENRLVQHLQLIARDLKNHQAWLDEALAHLCAHVRTSAHEETGEKEETEKEKVPHTPYKEKGKEENLKQNKILIDYRTPSGGTPSTGCAVNQSIDPVVSLAQEDSAEMRNGLDPALGEVESVAKNCMGLPDWYARWWHRYMSAAGWRTNRVDRVTRQNWRPLIMTWWRNASDEEREEIRREMCEPKPAALSSAETPRSLLDEYNELFKGL